MQAKNVMFHCAGRGQRAKNGRDRRQTFPDEVGGAIRVPAFGGCAYMIRRWVSFLMCVMIHPFFPFRFLPPVFAQHSPRTPGRNHRPASLFCFCQCPGARFRRPSHMSGADAPRPVSPRGSALVSPFKRRASACARPFRSIFNASPAPCSQRHPNPAKRLVSLPALRLRLLPVACCEWRFGAFLWGRQGVWRAWASKKRQAILP